ncbi:nuclear pore complex protein NUP35-like [Impatiens glandulifera]|uniref:nuclear pore complex protein NUP35-like n=1 Tax=Impatiens glandulifera TaxID=253017 RepID=UPI001FB15F11|nr:nuclear pore complex protein NUP35-like [Impatiens glandulifera]
MSSTIQRTPKSGRQSLFFHDLSSPATARREGSGKFTTPGQAAAVSALWRENFATSDLPPPPLFTLEDRADFSPEFGLPDFPTSPEIKSDPRTNRLDAVVSSDSFNNSPPTHHQPPSPQPPQQSPLASLSWWSPGQGAGSVDQEDKGKGSHVNEDVVQSGALITLPPLREVARPEMQRNSLPVDGNLDDEEEWITVYGFLPGDTNLVLREFEKCGVILKHVLGPRASNWMNILYQSRADAQKALSRNGLQINSVLIVGVKAVDPGQHQSLNERMNNNQGFVPLPPRPSFGKNSSGNAIKLSSRPYCLQNGSASSNSHQPGSTIATPAKSAVSKVMNLMFGI